MERLANPASGRSARQWEQLGLLERLGEHPTDAEGGSCVKGGASRSMAGGKAGAEEDQLEGWDMT